MATRTIRLPEGLHRLIRVAAAARGQSGHAWMLEALRAQILREARTQRGAPLAALLDGERDEGTSRSLTQKRSHPRF